MDRNSLTIDENQDGIRENHERTPSPSPAFPPLARSPDWAASEIGEDGGERWEGRAGDRSRSVMHHIPMILSSPLLSSFSSSRSGSGYIRGEIGAPRQPLTPAKGPRIARIEAAPQDIFLGVRSGEYCASNLIVCPLPGLHTISSPNLAADLPRVHAYHYQMDGSMEGAGTWRIRLFNLEK